MRKYRIRNTRLELDITPTHSRVYEDDRVSCVGSRERCINYWRNLHHEEASVLRDFPLAQTERKIY